MARRVSTENRNLSNFQTSFPASRRPGLLPGGPARAVLALLQALAQLRAQGINPDAVGKGPKTFPAKLLPELIKQSTEQPAEKYHRSAAADRTYNGEVFDSKLELAAYRWLADHGVKFETQVEVELQPGFSFEGKKIRKISYFADFKILADCSLESTEQSWEQSGQLETESFKLKWKLLLFKGVHVHKVKSVSALVTLLLEKGFWSKPATEPAI